MPEKPAPTSDGTRRATGAGGGIPTGTEFIEGRWVEHVPPAPGAPPLRVAVVGAGAVGGYYAARAAELGAQVILCVRRPFGRLRLVRSAPAAGGAAAGNSAGEQVIEVDARVVTRPEDIGGPVDWVILATKAHQTPEALPWLAAALGEGTGVVVAQNGVRHVERVSPPVPAAAVLPAVVYINAEQTEPGLVRHRNYGVMQVPDSPLAERFAATVLPPGDVRLLADFHSAAWSKLVVNSAVNSVTALTGQRMEVLRRPDIAALATRLMEEAVAVARADGAQVPAELPEFTLRRLRGQPPGAGTSMLYDRLAGRPLEHEALIGAVVRIGAELGVPTPASSALLPLLAAISDAGRRPG